MVNKRSENNKTEDTGSHKYRSIGGYIPDSFAGESVIAKQSSVEKLHFTK